MERETVREKTTREEKETNWEEEGTRVGRRRRVRTGNKGRGRWEGSNSDPCKSWVRHLQRCDIDAAGPDE